MATLNAYTDREGYYVKHSFVSEGKLIHVVYQTSERAIKILKGINIGDGDNIPPQILHRLRVDGELFTGKGGVEGEQAASSLWENTPEESLSQNTLNWLSDMTLHHPQTQIISQSETDDGFEITFKKSPNHYLEYLWEMARRFDGTDFFYQLYVAYQNLPPNHPFARAYQSAHGRPRIAGDKSNKPTIMSKKQFKETPSGQGLKGNQLSAAYNDYLKRQNLSSNEPDMFSTPS